MKRILITLIAMLLAVLPVIAAATNSRSNTDIPKTVVTNVVAEDETEEVVPPVVEIVPDTPEVQELQETLKTIREIMPPSAKIHPYVKKKPAILPAAPTKTKKKQPKKGGKPHSSLQSKKTVGKRHNIARLSKKKKVEFKKQVKSLRDLWKANKKKAGTTVQLDPKKASTNLKKAA